MTVARMRAEMDQAEYVAWSAWFALKAQREQLANMRR